MTTIIGYHVCKKDGGWSFLRENAPFLSGDGDNQWLTQGYYFWTDDEFFARKWGDSSYAGKYAILKCKLCFADGALLDLVGSVTHQRYFSGRLKKYKARIEKAGRSADDVKVGHVVAFLRKEEACYPGVFPFVAIKAQDAYLGGKLPFTTNKEEDRREVMPLLTRQQLCVFSSGRMCVSEKEVIYPDEFAKKAIKLVKAQGEGYETGF